MAAPFSLEIPMQILKSSHANNSNCRAHLARVGEQLGFPMAGGFRSLHIRNKLTAEHQRPTSGSLIKTEIHVSPVTYYVFSTPLLNWARVQAVAGSAAGLEFEACTENALLLISGAHQTLAPLNNPILGMKRYTEFSGLQAE